NSDNRWRNAPNGRSACIVGTGFQLAALPVNVLTPSSVATNTELNSIRWNGAASQCAIRDKVTFVNVASEAGNSNLILAVIRSAASASHATSLSKARNVKHRPS